MKPLAARAPREAANDSPGAVPLEELLMRCPDLEAKIELLHMLHWELTKQLEAPVVDVPYCEALFRLNCHAVPLREKLWSDI